MTVAKANMRATVHRPQHADVVATRISTPAGAWPAGGCSSASSPRAPTTATRAASRCCGAECDRILALRRHRSRGHDGRALRNILDTWPRDELFQAPEAAILAGAPRALDLTIRPRAGAGGAARPLRALRLRHRLAAARHLRHAAARTRRPDAGARLRRAALGLLHRARRRAAGARALHHRHRPGRGAGGRRAALEAAIAQAARGFGTGCRRRWPPSAGRPRRPRAGPLARRLPRRLSRGRDGRAGRGRHRCWPNARWRRGGPRADLLRAPGAGPRR